MSSTQDLCDGVAALHAAMRHYEQAVASGEDPSPQWQQVRRAIGYMTTMAAWKEDMTAAEMLAQGRTEVPLDSRWDPDGGEDLTAVRPH